MFLRKSNKTELFLVMYTIHDYCTVENLHVTLDSPKSNTGMPFNHFLNNQNTNRIELIYIYIYLRIYGSFHALE